MQEQYKHSSVFLTVLCYDSKESKKMAVFYETQGKTKQRKSQKQIFNKLTKQHSTVCFSFV